MTDPAGSSVANPGALTPESTVATCGKLAASSGCGKRVHFPVVFRPIEAFFPCARCRCVVSVQYYPCNYFFCRPLLRWLNIRRADIEVGSFFSTVERCFRFPFVILQFFRRNLPVERREAEMSRDSAAAMKVRKPEPAEIEYKNMRFLITYRPTDATMDRFVEELKRHNVKDVVRVCDPTYNTSRLMQEGISVMDLPFDDGTPPPDDVITEWFNLLRSRFTSDPSCCVAVHCIAGLGRAPVLVALALIELGMKYEDAVELIREKRRGAINAKQLAYLEKYHPKSRLKSRNNGHKPNCVIM